MNVSDYLAHYGVKGQKWGQRQWQNEDGTYTEAGKHHYGWGYGYQNRGHNGGEYQPSKPPRYAKTEYRNMGPKPPTMYRPKSPEQVRQEVEARKAKAKRIIGIAAGLAVAGLAAYGAHRLYRYSGNLRNEMINQAREKAKQATYEQTDKIIGRDNILWDRYRRDPSGERLRIYKEKIKSLQSDIDRYNNIASTATRRKAIRNWLRNGRRIIV